MARQGTLKNAIYLLITCGVLTLMLAGPVMAQDDNGGEGGIDKFAKVQATSDSLGFGSSAADSLKEIPQIINHNVLRKRQQEANYKGAYNSNSAKFLNPLPF